MFDYEELIRFLVTVIFVLVIALATSIYVIMVLVHNLS